MLDEAIPEQMSKPAGHGRRKNRCKRAEIVAQGLLGLCFSSSVDAVEGMKHREVLDSYPMGMKCVY